jgi:NitT/TauT family transport system permease protein
MLPSKDKENQKKQSFSHEHQQFIKKLQRKQLLIGAVRILLLILFFSLWEFAANMKWIDSFLFSQPSRILKTFVKLHSDGSLYLHTGITVAETVAGFILGTLLGTLIAIVLWWSDFLSKVLDPYLVVLNSLPKVALGPIIIVWAGAGIPAILTMALTISVFTTIIGVYSGLNQASKGKVKLLETFGATKKQILVKVVLPSSFPTIMNALKINVGLSWVGVIMGEFLVSKSGLGYLIVYGSQVFTMDLVMTSVIILALAAAIMYIGVIYLEKLLIKGKY